MKKLKVVISGGGTGGHIFPALAIAKAIEKQVSDVEFLFVGAEDRMEMEKVPNEGYTIIGLWISGLQRGLDKRNLLFPFKVVHSILKAKKIIKDFKPDIVHTHASKAGAVGRLAAFNQKVPVVVHTFHGHVFHSYFGAAKTQLYKSVERYLAKKSTTIIAISDKQKHELTQIYKIAPPEKTHVINLGFDLNK